MAIASVIAGGVSKCRPQFASCCASSAGHSIDFDSIDLCWSGLVISKRIAIWVDARLFG